MSDVVPLSDDVVVQLLLLVERLPAEFAHAVRALRAARDVPRKVAAALELVAILARVPSTVALVLILSLAGGKEHVALRAGQRLLAGLVLPALEVCGSLLARQPDLGPLAGDAVLLGELRDQIEVELDVVLDVAGGVILFAPADLPDLDLLVGPVHRFANLGQRVRPVGRAEHVGADRVVGHERAVGVVLEFLLVGHVLSVGHDEQRPRLRVLADRLQQQGEERVNLVEDGVGDHVLAGDLVQLL